MVALQAPADAWAAFSEEWEIARKISPAIEYFSAAECWMGQGQFKGIEIVERMGKAETLARLVEKYVFQIHSFFVSHQDFEYIFKSQIDHRYDDPYFFMATQLIEELIEIYKLSGFRDEIDFIFDSQPNCELFVNQWFDARSDNLSKTKDYAEILKNKIAFQDEKKTPPLQAADLAAWYWRRTNAEFFYGTDLKPYFWPAFQILSRLRTHNIHTDVDFMHACREGINSTLPNNHLFFHQAVRYRDNLDIKMSRDNASQLKAEVTPLLSSISTKKMKRFHLCYSCENSDSPHLHSREKNRCLLNRR